MTTARGRAFANVTGAPLSDDAVCPVCTMRFSAAAGAEFHSHIRAHEDRMAKKVAPKKSARRQPANARPPAFISADDLKGKTKFRLLPSISVYERDNNSSLFLGIENQKRESFTWGVRLSSPDRIALQQRFGRNILDWPGKIVELVPVDGSRGGRFVNLYDPDRPQSSAPSREPGSDDDVPF